MRKVFLSTLIYTLVIGAIFGIIVILLGAWNELTYKVLAITGTIFGFSIPGLLCSSLYDKNSYKNVASTGMIICFISSLVLILNILTDFSFGSIDSISKCILILTLLSCSFGHISRLLMENTNNKTILNIRNITIVLSILIDTLWIFRILIENDDHFKLDAILAILISLGTIVVPIANKIVSKNSLNNLDANLNQEEKIVLNQEAKPVVEETLFKENIEVNEDKYDKIQKLKNLLDSNAISQEEYDSEKKKILENE